MSQATQGRQVAFTATLALSMGIGPFAVNAISVLAPRVVPELGLTRAELGTLPTLTFAVAGAVSFLVGARATRAGGRRVLLAVFLAGALAVTAMMGARSLPWLWVGALLGGLSQAVSIPVTNQLVAELSPPGRRGVPTGVKQSGVQMVQTLVALTLPPLAVWVGWRGSLWVGVVLAALGAVAVWRVIPPGSLRGPPRPRGHREALDPGVWWLTGYILVLGLTVQAVLVYTPLYAHEQVGLGPTVAGFSTGVLAVTGIAARIVWSRAVERSARPARMLLAFAIVAALGVGLILTAEQGTPVMLWLGLILFGGSAIAVNAVIMMLVIKRSPEGSTGRASGIVSLGLYAGFMLGPLGFGSTVDATGSYAVGWGAVVACCLAGAALAGAWMFQERTR
ncbi:MFS transporter [Egibacter rhizosphaerae]|uniref:MFS transporter n=1 Tax=Egibacter rhizosphaerae TaxID=1670831 RepID=A0A411YIY4_9ACTN|nr:MFS transporter [Egibacter rhizosphaerae]QBI21111.1 MFS transporter [Egibacter rhizosphaerae]